MSVGAAGQSKQTEQDEGVFHGEDLLSFGKDMHCGEDSNTTKDRLREKRSVGSAQAEVPEEGEVGIRMGALPWMHIR